MKIARSRGASRLTLLLLTLLLPLWAAAATPFSRLVVFGDSLSDPGNVFVATHEVSTRPYQLIPEWPYPIGGMTYSNGPTWIQQLAGRIDLQRSVKPALRAPGVFSNYAFGGARARASGIFDLTTQVAYYLQDFGAKPPRNALYVIFIGGDDVRDAIEAYASDPSGATSASILQSAVTAISDNILALYGSSVGARDFLIANAPDLSLVPAVRLQGLQVQLLARGLSQSFNQGLAQALAGLQALPGISFTNLDVFSLLERTVAMPPAGLHDVQDTCITPGVIQHAICRHPDSYLFWDGIHPTETGHAIVAHAAAHALGLFYGAHERRHALADMLH